MNSELLSLLSNYRQSRNFNPAEWVDNRCRQFYEYLVSSGLTGQVLPVSGGIDSAATLGLLVTTQRRYPDALKLIWPLNQPIESADWANSRAQELCDAMGVDMITIDSTEEFRSLASKIETQTSTQGTRFARGNMKSYMRTPVAHYAAQLMASKKVPSSVMLTGNFDEDHYLRYFCNAGDGTGDLQLIWDLHKSEVFKVAEFLGVPKSILEAAPSADLWDGQTDEEELGCSYDFVELFTGHYLSLTPEEQSTMKEKLSDEAREEFERCATLCVETHDRNAHKAFKPLNIGSEA